MANEKTGAAYTIIEILVVLSVVGIVFAVGFANFRDFSRRQVLSGSLRTLKGDLRLAQEYALIGKKPEDPYCDSPNVLNGYNFLVSSSSEYTVLANCSGGTVDINKNIVLTADISISAPSPNPITFKALGQGTNFSADATITLTQLSTGDTTSVVVTQGGEIK